MADTFLMLLTLAKAVAAILSMAALEHVMFGTHWLLWIQGGWLVLVLAAIFCGECRKAVAHG